MGTFQKIIKSIVLMIPVVIAGFFGWWLSGRLFGFEDEKYVYHIAGILLFAGIMWYFRIVRPFNKS